MFACLMNDIPCFLSNPKAGWEKHTHASLSEAQEYMDAFLGDYSPGKDYFQIGAFYIWNGMVFEIKYQKV